MGRIAKGEASAGAAQQDYSGHAVTLVADPPPHQIRLTELAQSFLAVCHAEPALSGSIIDKARASAADMAKEGINF